MPLTTDQQRVKDLLTETITLLCKNGLQFKSEFTIEGLIGITVDQNDVFLINLNENVCLGRSEAADVGESSKTSPFKSPAVQVKARPYLPTARRGRPSRACYGGNVSRQYPKDVSASRPLMRALLSGCTSIVDPTTCYGSVDLSRSGLPATMECDEPSMMRSSGRCQSPGCEVGASSGNHDTELLADSSKDHHDQSGPGPVHESDDAFASETPSSDGSWMHHHSRDVRDERNDVVDLIQAGNIKDETFSDDEDANDPGDMTRETSFDEDQGKAADNSWHEFNLDSDHVPSTGNAYFSSLMQQHSDSGVGDYDTFSYNSSNSTLENPIQYTIMPCGTNRGGAAIISSDGHRYGIKMVKPNVTYWRCVVRNRLINCRAVVIQRGKTFVQGSQRHCHAPLHTDDVMDQPVDQPL